MVAVVLVAHLLGVWRSGRAHQARSVLEAVLPFVGLASLALLLVKDTGRSPASLALYVVAAYSAHRFGRNWWLLVGVAACSLGPWLARAFSAAGPDLGAGIAHLVFPALAYHFLSDWSVRARAVEEELATLKEQRALDQVRDHRLAIAREIHDGLGASPGRPKSSGDSKPNGPPGR